VNWQLQRLCMFRPCLVMMQVARQTWALWGSAALLGSSCLASTVLLVYACLHFKALIAWGEVQDDVFARLLTFPNVLITAHQAFLTHEALCAIAETTLSNIADVLAGRKCDNIVEPQ
jgi:hypothetical protein